MDIGLEQNGTWNSYILHASAVSWDIFRHTQVADIAHWAPWVLCAVDTDIWHHDTHLFCDAGLQRLLAAWAARAQVSPDSGSRRDYPHEMAASSHSVSLIKTQLSLCFMLRMVINFLKDKRFLAPSGSQGVALCACLSRAIILHHYGPDRQATELCALRLSLKYIVLLYFYVFVSSWTTYMSVIFSQCYISVRQFRKLKVITSIWIIQDQRRNTKTVLQNVILNLNNSWDTF